MWLLTCAASAAVPDVSFTLNEAAANEAAQQLIGLEIKLANGAQLRLKSVTLELQSQQAAFQLGIEARAANTMGLPLNLTLKGFIKDAQRTDTKLILPVTLTDVTLANGLLTPLLKLLFGEWLSPARWSAAIPALELPASFAQTVDIPASTVDVAGDVPMTVTTQAMQLPLNFALVRVGFAENRLSIALQSAENANEEVGELAADGDAPFAVRISRRALATLLQAVANANAQDLSLKLKPARIRQEEIDTLVKVTNYTEVISGEGQADLKQVVIETLRDGLLGARLLALGNFTAQVKGREYGIPYRLSPRGQFGIQDRGLSLRLMSEAGHVWLQGLPNAFVPVNLRMNFPLAAGREFGFDRQLNLPAERMVNHWELPALWAREFALPRKLVVQADKSFQIVESQPLTLALSQLQATTRDDAVLLTAAFAVSKPALPASNKL